jgi:hypothetical protein
MTYQAGLEIAAAWSAIGTLAIAVFAYGKFLFERTTKRNRLESYLKAEQAAGEDRGQRTLVHLVAKVGMSETEIMDCAFKSNHIKRTV